MVGGARKVKESAAADAVLAPRPRHRHSRRVMVTQPIWPRLAAADPIAARVAGTSLTLIEHGPDRLQAILDLIAGAQASLRMLFYMFSNDHSGTAVRDALLAAIGRGVEVKLLLDGFGSAGTPVEFFQPISDAGGQFCRFHPRYGRRYLLRNHQKLVIADDRRALIGGANIQDSYLLGEGPPFWRDLLLALDGDAVPPASKYFDAVYRWTTRKGAKLRSLKRLVRRHSDFRGDLQWKFSGPLSLRNPWPASIVREICDGCRLDMIAAYFSPPRAMLRRLGHLGRNSGVRIITAAKSDNQATIGAARDTYSRLLRSKVEMYEYQPTKLHTKLAIAGDVTYIGSANFDFRSLYINCEIMLRIDHAGFANKMRTYFERELADSLAITPELHKSRASPLRRLKWRVSHWLVTSMDYTMARRFNLGAEL
ncbi:phosphatidylserine/phosphatidylglycerophosphate/cardiolipin synthase family protein [Sphingomonas sp.]|uniref:phospholipase D-like domain-containing protein n=1 Tax=Sphingomonas sp. TaxID=28214 RepID=UPI00286D8BDA|nr:phosphatidylserine/phosphatidylglycerophosphate/cardiolipin synthase family protein [Sphingomonas sp.]